MKRLRRSMLEGPLLQNIIAYTIPIILTSLLQLLFNAADLVIVGRFRGSLSVAAVSSTTSLISLITNLFIGLSIGASVTVAHGLGSRQDIAVHRTVHTALPTALAAGSIVTVIGVTCSKMFLELMGTPISVLPLATLYMKIYFSGAIFTLVYNFCAAILRAAGDTKSPLLYLSLAGIINVLLNLLFVRQFNMNVEGVALATVISQAISAILVTVALMRRTDACRLYIKKIRFYRKQLLKLIRIGLPAGIQSSFFAISNVIVQSSINSFGDTLMSGSGAAASIEGFLYVSVNAFHQTAINFIGQNAGAGLYKRVKKSLYVCLGCAVTLAAVLGGLVTIFGEELLSIYINDSPTAVHYGIVRFQYVAVFYFLCALMDVTTGALRGIGASLIPMLISVLGVCGIRLGWIYTVFRHPAYHTPECLYTSYPLSWLITFLLQLLAFFLVYRRHVRENIPHHH